MTSRPLKVLLGLSFAFFLSACGNGFSVATHTYDQYLGNPGEYCNLPADFSGLPSNELSYTDAQLITLRETAKTYVAQNKLQEAIWLYEDDPEASQTVSELKQKLEALLSSDTFTMQDSTLGGAFEKYILDFGNGVKAVFKPGGTPSNEWIAYRLDAILKFSLVPMTIDRQVNGRTGTVQYFVSGMSSGAVTQVTSTNFRKMIVFDFLLRNRDRDLNNFLYWPEMNRIVAIDHGASFYLSCGIPDEIKKHLQIEKSLSQRISSLDASLFSSLMGSTVPLGIRKLIWKQFEIIK